MNNFLALLFFVIPIVFFKYVNANYLTTKTFLLYFASSLAFFAIPDRITLRKFGRGIGWLLGLIFLYYVSFHFISGRWYDSIYLFKMLSFAGVSLFVYSQDLSPEELLRRTAWPFALMWIVIVGMTGYELFQLRILDSNIKTDIILSTFGNVNMMSEFLVLSFPLLFLWSRRTPTLARPLKLFFIFAVSFFILYGRSRSAWMALALWLAFKVYRRLSRAELGAFAAAILLFAVSHFTAPDTESISKLVPQAFSERSSLYKGTLELLRDRPWGIRPGQFMNEIVPYLIDKTTGPNEFAYFDQPHSEYLKWGVQFGWLFLVMSMALIVMIALDLFKRSREKRIGDDDYYIETFLVLLPQMTFQFPFENPASILVLGVAFGLYLSSFPRVKSFSVDSLKYVFRVVAVLGIVNSIFFFQSIFLESAYPVSVDVMNVVCRYYPVNFRACYWKNKDLLDIKNIPAFKTEFKNDFTENPFFCDNLRLVPEYFNYSQNAKKTCEALYLYREIYKEQKQFKPEAFEQCKSFSTPFRFKNPAQFNEAFRKWFTD